MSEVTVQHKSPSLLVRYERVITILIKYGFEDILAHPPLNRLVPANDKWVPMVKGQRFDAYTRFERIRMACEELGTTFIKFAQIASNRPDILPADLIEELTKLQDQVPEVPWEDIEAILQLPENRDIRKLAKKIDPRPIASASIAQVHRATILGDRPVVLKVMRPGIKETVEADITILNQLAGLVEDYLPQYKSFQPKELVRMFELSIRKELQFKTEANNHQRFSALFKGHPDIYIPRLYEELTSDSILCMEYIDGKKITDVEQHKKVGLTGKELAFKGINLYFEQVFDHGFFHADPHPGNIFLLDDGRICLIDFGMMGTVMEKDKLMLGNLLLAVYNEDVQGLKRSLLRLGGREKILNETELEYDILDFFTAYRHKPISDIDNDEVIKALNSLFFDYKIKVPSHLLLLLKTLVIIEGVGLKLDPHYNIIENIQPFAKRLIKRKFRPAKVSRHLLSTVEDFVDLFVNLPGDLKNVVHKASEGKLHIEFEHKGLERLYEKLEIVSNRLSFTLVLVALILGSSIIVHSQLPPFINGIPALGFIGFCISGFLALRLLVSIIKHGNF